MRCCVFTVVLLFGTLSVSSQSSPVSSADIEKVQEVVGALITNHEKAYVLLRDLSEIEGHVLVLQVDAFQLGSDKKARFGHRVRYEDVLVISGKGLSVSLIPEPKTPGFGSWADLRKLPVFTLVEVVTTSGEAIIGGVRFARTDELVIAKQDGNGNWTGQRAEIAYVYRLKKGGRDVSGGIAGGASKGAKVGSGAGGGVRGPISGSSGDGHSGVGAALGAGVGALIGAAKGAASKTPTLRVLLYSR